jgi:NCK-associated protein 1
VYQNFQDATDPTTGFLLDGMGKLCCLVRKYTAGLSNPAALSLKKEDFLQQKKVYLNVFFFTRFVFLFAAIKGYALSYLSSCAGRIRFLLGTPGMVALDLDATLKGLFQQVLHCLENIPKPQGESVPAITCDLSVRVLLLYSLRFFLLVV